MKKIKAFILLIPLFIFSLFCNNNMDNMKILFNNSLSVVQHIYVDQNCPGATHDGESWNTAFLTIQDGVESATGYAEVWVAAGTYDVSTGPYPMVGGTLPMNKTLLLKENVGIYGGFNGTESARSQRDWNANPTIITGANSSYHVVTGANETIVDGFTIRDGIADDGSDISTCSGAGIYNSVDTGYMQVTISNCSFINNTVSDAGVGAAIYNYHTVAVISNCFFYSNQSDYYAGAIYNGNNNISIPTIIENCIFINNSGAYGGTIVIYGTTTNATIRNCTFTQNTGSDGIVYAQEAAVTLVNSILHNNTYTSPSTLYEFSGGTITASYSCIEGESNPGLNIIDSNSNDPQFIGGALSSPNYVKLGGTSATNESIDSGSAASAPARDFEGNSRPIGGGVDIGAFEK